MKTYVLQILIKDSDQDGVLGCYSTLDKVKEKIINFEEECVIPMDEFDPKAFEENIIIPTKEAQTVEELNDIYEDLFFVKEWEIDK